VVGIVRGELGDAWKWIDDGLMKKAVGDGSGKGHESDGNVEQVDGRRKSKSKKRVQ
jgi:hypothetical protein